MRLGSTDNVAALTIIQDGLQWRATEKKGRCRWMVRKSGIGAH